MRVDPNYISNLSAAISASSNQEAQLTAELSSGLRVQKLSDDPVAASTNVTLESSISRLDDFVQSASSQTAQLQVTDSTLGEVVSQVTSAISLAVAGGDATLSTANFAAIAKQVSGIRNNVVALANTSYSGQYLFSGTSGDTRPFTLDSSTDPATVTYNGDANPQRIQTADGQSIQVNLAGSDVFTSSSGNLLGALNQLVSDLTAGDQTAVAADSSALSTALGQVTSQRASLDSSLSTLNATSGYASTQESLLKAQQTTLLSSDTAQVATDLSTSEVQHQALLSVVSTLSQVNLFSFLNK